MLDIKKIASVALLSALLLTSCSQTEAELKPILATADIFAMDTFMTVKAYGPNADQLLDEAKLVISGLEKSLSVTNPESDIYRLNHANGEPTELCEDAARIIARANEISELTDGSLDISIYPLVSAWGFTTGEYTIPDENTIHELLKLVDHTKIRLEDKTVSLEDGMQIDLGAVAKGYTGDKLAALLKNGNVTSALINLGGNIHTVGAKPDGTPWKIAIADPFSPEKELLHLEIIDKVVITSGNYERYFIGEDGKHYCHIIDPKSGYPSENGVVSMTVVGDSGITADALSTALFAAGAEKAVELWNTLDSFEMIFVTDENKLYITEGLVEQYTNVSSLQVEIIRHGS